MKLNPSSLPMSICLTPETLMNAENLMRFSGLNEPFGS
jgi:hypothetical protein